MTIDILIDRSDLTSVTRRTTPTVGADELGDGEVLLAVSSFGLPTNNITYAVFGDVMGYWAYFPADDGRGLLPVWGFAEVVASASSEISVGERVFGYLPMSSHLVVVPSDITAHSFSDGAAHRAPLHPWYNRYHRVATDPVAEHELQPVLWALFMTGWMLADELATTVDEVMISSASSKTATSLAWSLRRAAPEISIIGVTSDGNRSFVEKLGIYSAVVSYDELPPASEANRVAFVDMAGNGEVAASIHDALDDRLVDSVRLGATHRAPPAEPSTAGATPRLFFVPDVAEARAAADPDDHAAFASAFGAFLGWAETWIELDRGAGADAIEAAYHAALAGRGGPQRATVRSWS